MKTCELCKRIARTHCESDRASLCWGCDYKVHSANFLVARHSRTLLCQICQSPTPWTATGLKIGPTVSVCDTCVQNYNKSNYNEEIEDRNGDEEMESTDSFDDEDEEEDEDLEYDSGEETDCEDNQVVPWSPSSPPPTSTTDSSSDEESSSSSFSSLSSPRNQREALRKRTREDTDRCYNVQKLLLFFIIFFVFPYSFVYMTKIKVAQVNFVSRPSQANADAPPPMETVEVLEAAAEAKDDSSAADVGTFDSVDSLSTMAENSLKKRRIQTGKSEISEFRAWVVVESINKLQQEGMVSSEVVAQLRRLREEDLSAVDYDSSDST